MSDFASFRNEIYFGGLTGSPPPFPFRADELVARAREVMDDRSFWYVAGGGGADRTVAHNRRAFEDWRLVPRHMRDIRERDLAATVLGTRMAAPVMVAPVGVQSIIHPDAEVATARAAAALGLPMVLSTASSRTIEDVADAMDDVAAGSPRWFQLYWPSDRELAASLVDRAEQAGHEAIVVTLDIKELAWRPSDLDGAYLPFLHGEGVANYFSDPVFRARLEAPPEEDRNTAILAFIGLFADKSLTWDDLAVLRATTRLPIVVKGVLHPDDARLAVAHGADGIVVSNHGGRQVDNAIGALAALPDVVAAAGDVPVLFDSGVRTGADVLVALALGARAVMVGRPWCWGLALGGEEGVRHVLRSLLADLELTLALCGLGSIDQVTRDVVVPASHGRP